MADTEADLAAAGQPKRRTFRKFSFRGVDLDALLDMSTDELVKLFTARARRRFQRGLKRKPMALIKISVSSLKTTTNQLHPPINSIPMQISRMEVLMRKVISKTKKKGIQGCH
ncbi:hypothetical protein ACHQM5_023332 [Ranunculus cassubicifolius]